MNNQKCSKLKRNISRGLIGRSEYFSQKISCIMITKSRGYFGGWWGGWSLKNYFEIKFWDYKYVLCFINWLELLEKISTD